MHRQLRSPDFRPTKYAIERGCATSDTVFNTLALHYDDNVRCVTLVNNSQAGTRRELGAWTGTTPRYVALQDACLNDHDKFEFASRRSMFSTKRTLAAEWNVWLGDLRNYRDHDVTTLRNSDGD